LLFRKENEMPDWTRYRTDGCLFEATPSPAPTLRAPTDDLPQHVDLRRHLSAGRGPGPYRILHCECDRRCAGIAPAQGGPAGDRLSRLFLYYNLARWTKNEDKDSGSFIHHGMAALMAFGVCEERMWPYLEPMFSTRPTEAAYQNATRYEAVSSHARRAADRRWRRWPRASRSPSACPCRQLLSRRRRDRRDADAGELPDPGQPSGHAMLLVGYDLGKEAYLVRNSWGSRFGENGYCWIPFKVMDAWSEPDHFWAIGAIEQAPGFSLIGPSIAETVENVTSKVQGPSPLDMLRGQLRERLNTRLDAARADFRNRLRGGR
jgi:hypothetical protein